MAPETLEEFLLDRGAEPVWELFHENSKLSAHEPHLYFGHHPSDATVLSVMRRLRTVKEYGDRPKLALPDELPPAGRSLDDTLLGRVTARRFGGGPIELAQLAKILRFAYGVTRDNAGTEFPRPFRTVPSGGALFPLELYVVVRAVEGLAPGLYHYDPEDHTLDALRTGEDGGRASGELASHLVQGDLAREAAAAVVVSAVFFRSTFKYGDRGYRFVLLEAGHVGQNVLLTAGGLGLAATPVGGFMDRDVDRWLGLDGIDESVVYLLLIGPPGA